MNDRTSSPRRQVTRAFCTTREAAEILGVSLRTVQMWSNSGLLELWKTSGGHRRISRESVERLVVRTGATEGRARGSEPGSKPAAATTDRGTGKDSGPLRILAVDDEPDLLRLYRLNLARWPMHPQVITASDGYEALILIGRELPDLLLLDLNMPGLDGFHVLRTLREMPELKAMRIVIVTGLSEDEIRAHGDIPPEIPVLPKPIPFAQLQEIAGTLQARRSAAGG